MVYCFSVSVAMNFFACSLVLATAFSASAQQTIIFSKPADMSAEKANSFLPNSTHNAGDFNAPRQLFHDYTPDLPLPKPLLLDESPEAKAAMDRRKNWTLLTPDQVLGIQTPEEILGMVDKPDEKKLSLEEQFLLRESRASATAATNGRALNPLWRQAEDANPFADKNKDADGNPLRPGAQNLEPGARYFNQLLNAQDSETGPDGKPNSPWNTDFSQPTQLKPSPEQLADMERFRALMEPSAPPPVVTPVMTRFAVAPVAGPDPFLQPTPAVNPAGRMVPSLENIFSRPTGINPLPGISTPPPKPVATKPSWQAQLPPWLTDGPQTHNPARNF
jgi:hypothetical protein